MNEYENVQPEETLEGRESTESVEQETLQDAAVEPGTHIEETQGYEQAEAVEKAVVEAMDEARVPEGVEFELAGEDGAVGRDDDGLIKDPDLSEASGDKDDDDKDEATPINLPGPVTADEALSVLPIPLPKPASEESGSRGGGADELGVNMEPIPSPEQEVAGSERGEQLGAMPVPLPKPTMDGEAPGDGGGQVAATPINLPYVADEAEGGEGGRPGGQIAQEPMPDPDPGFTRSQPGGGVDVSPIPVPLPRPAIDPQPLFNVPGEVPSDQLAKDHPGPGGQVAQQPDPGPIPDRNEVAGLPIPLFNAPDFEAMNISEQAVVEVIGKAIANEDYRSALFADAREATAGYEVTDDDQVGLNEMTEESFDFFAAEVEARFGEATANNPEVVEEQVMAQVVHAVWRDLNPGSLVYVLAYKIPRKHL